MPVSSLSKPRAGSGCCPRRTRKAKLTASAKSQILKGLAHPVRVSVFEVLAGSELSAGQLASALGVKESNLSRHLAVMKAAGLLSARKQGLKIFYSVKLPCLLSMLSCLDDGLCQLADEHREMARLVRGNKK